MILMITLKRSGQATVEYIFILAFAIFLGLKVTNLFTNFFRDTMGSVGHVLSTNLIVGICPKDCFYSGYANGYEGQ
jgi:hypothetical protein